MNSLWIAGAMLTLDQTHGAPLQQYPKLAPHGTVDWYHNKPNTDAGGKKKPTPQPYMAIQQTFLYSTTYTLQKDTSKQGW